MNFRTTAFTACGEANRPSSAALIPAFIFAACHARTSAVTSCEVGSIASSDDKGFWGVFMLPILHDAHGFESSAACRPAKPRQERCLSAISNPPRQPVRRLFDLVQPAVETQPEEGFAALPEGGAGSKTDIGAVDDLEGCGP
jgi:hypothetical protein